MINFTGNKVIISKLDKLNIAQTLECGQCFRFEKISDNSYKIVALGKVLYIAEVGDTIEFSPTTAEEFETIWMPYFDLNRDYAGIQHALSQNDPVMQKAVEFSPALRVLNQEPWETLISFIISQHNAIPNIMRVVNALCKSYGNAIPQTSEFSFPTPEALFSAGLDGLAACKTGFRARYILDACQKALNGELILSRNSNHTTAEIKENLLRVKGVGDKVADCTLLYGYGRSDCFPIDVWIKRAMERFYFDGKETSQKDVYRFTTEKYGINAGFANIYLFNYIRTLR